MTTSVSEPTISNVATQTAAAHENRAPATQHNESSGIISASSKRRWRIVSKSDESRVYAVRGTQVLERQGLESDPDPFGDAYDSYFLLAPYYDFRNLFDIMEESDTVQSCISAMIEGIDGPGHDFQFVGDDEQRTKKANQTALQSLRDFFNNVNESGSFVNVRKRVRYDMEATGNAAIEVVRSPATGRVEQLYHMPITYMRMQKIDWRSDQIAYDIPLPRDGKMLTVTRKKRFRKYCRRLPDNQLRWYKEFGDPRTMDATTGEYTNSPKLRATEIWWFKIPFRNYDYGAPRWVGCISIVKARSLAHFVNYDLFNNQGIPPLMIIVEDGQLTDASIDEIENTLERWRDPSQFNRVCILQTEANMMGFSGQKGKSSVQIQQLRQARAEDYMFQQFLNYSENTIYKSFRLPPLNMGGTGAYNYASSYAAQTTVEQQVFAPIRAELDEAINIRILRQELGITQWQFKSKGPKVAGSDELGKIVRVAALSGGPSMNQLLEIWNEALGTDWSTSKNPVYNIPVNLLNSITRNGQIEADENGEIKIVPPQAKGGPGQEGGPGGMDLAALLREAGQDSDSDTPAPADAKDDAENDAGKTGKKGNKGLTDKEDNGGKTADANKDAKRLRVVKSATEQIAEDDRASLYLAMAQIESEWQNEMDRAAENAEDEHVGTD